MKSLKYHPHLVCLIGYVPDALSPMLLIEYCSNGDLLHFVRNNKNQIVHVSRVSQKVTKKLTFRVPRIQQKIGLLPSFFWIRATLRNPKYEYFK
jgi:hypothetical protein